MLRHPGDPAVPKRTTTVAWYNPETNIYIAGFSLYDYYFFFYDLLA